MTESRPSTPPPEPSSPPNLELGPYTLLDRIATGGMAEVFRAREPRAAGEPRTVVVKRMLPHIAAQAGARQMFEEEARLASFVQHVNVVQVFGLGEHDGHPYLALEYVRGVDLHQLVRRLGRESRSLGVALTVFVVRELLAGLHAVHEARASDGRRVGIIHRDVSPSNVLLSRHGQVKLGDFGIAGRIEESYQYGMGRKGKLGYLAPEQVMGHSVDRATDVFASGVIAAELLMGRPLFTGGSELAILLAIRDAKVQPFLDAATELPDGLRDVIVEALAADPKARIASADELRNRLAPYQGPDSEAELRQQLGALVSETMHEQAPLADEDAGQPEADTADWATPVQDALPDAWNGPSPELADLATPVADTGRRTPQPEVEGRPTGELPGIEYRVRASGGSSHGPWTYAKTVEAIATGRLAPTDQISVDGAPFQPIHERSELQRHLPPSSLSATTRDAQPPAPEEQLALSDGGIITTFAHAVVRQDRGLWLYEQDSRRKEVYVSDGMPQFVSSNVAGELLGEDLVRKEVLSRGELDMALAVMPRFEGKLGDTLIALDLVEPVKLFQHIATQVRDRVLELFTWTYGTATFYGDVPAPARGFPLGLDTWELVDQGIARRLADRLEEARFRSRMTSALVRVEPLPADVQLNALPEAARRLWERLHEPMLLAEAADAISDEDDPNRGYRTVILLLHLAAIRWDEP